MGSQWVIVLRQSQHKELRNRFTHSATLAHQDIFAYLPLSIYLRVFILCILDINTVDHVVVAGRGGGAVLCFAPAIYV